MLWVLGALAVFAGFSGVMAFGLSRSMLYLGQLCKGDVPFMVRGSATMGVVGSAGVLYGGLLLPFASSYQDCVVLGLGILIVALSTVAYLISMKRWSAAVEARMKTHCPVKTS